MGIAKRPAAVSTGTSDESYTIVRQHHLSKPGQSGRHGHQGVRGFSQ